MVDRVDGCSWLMTKEDFNRFGPLPASENNITGDVVIHDRLQRAGYKSYIVRDCVTYHFVRAERLIGDII
jgi:GT2 family glycosyltransferase